MQPRKKITLTIWQWPSGEITAFLEQLRVDGEHFPLLEPKRVAQTTVRKGATPGEVLAALAVSWGQVPAAQEDPTPS